MIRAQHKLGLTPLIPVAAFGEHFRYLLVNCIGQLPSTKSENKHHLSIVETPARFPSVLKRRTTPHNNP